MKRRKSIWMAMKRMTNSPDRQQQDEKRAIPGGAVPLPGERSGMEPVVMTPEELAEYLKNMPENMILRVTVQEDSHGSENGEKV